MTDPILQFFAWDHLPPRLAQVSKPFQALAEAIVVDLPDNAERAVCLRMVLVAKDAAVRSVVYREPA
jgi:hypothetical protein